ncbi:sterol desaturase family protein [Ramlibacter ginsenosidimutans]|uniref:Sterol desaturase family protein n=1 Tax=Ramlibacter ginsenosidimutans TaxID=502333 RepID=A0A934TP15_9BURK|nr:lysoplasmalogenase family protein [Ramlibacter ginsenosidimutans]MBK6004886.1 sterol desaturase family protein [Ramlibacter ginsenosidimutans]
MQLSPSQVIVLATPVFLLSIGIEAAWGRWRGRNTYRLNDAINSLSLGVLSQVSAVLTRLFRIGIYTAVFSWVSLWHADAFWTSLPGWLLALLFYDFCYYWLHRAGHEVAVFWAAHVVHHQSQDYNLSTALRQTSTGALLGWIFYLPMAVAGVPPLVFGVVALVDLLYQFWVHTEHVGKLGWFDRWFCSPSNHRVHHAVNDGYLDRNYGGVLIVWDRLFGSFTEEGEPCVYGTRAPLESWDPLWSNFEVYWALARDSWHARSWADKLRVWFKPPGWRPADVAQRFPKPAFSMAAVRRYHPPMTPALAWFACVQFVVLLAAALVFLWQADQAPVADLAVWLAVLAASLWAVGASMQGRMGMLDVLLVEAAALATATSVQGWVAAHQVFKPLALLLAIAVVATRSGWMRQQRAFDLKLSAALLLCLTGDVLLMRPGLFIPGLVAFLLAHLCYLALFRQGVRWFASRTALACTLGAAVAMYAALFPFLGPVLKGAVAAYALVIALMAAQAIGRATLLRDAASTAVAIGAVFFMLSDGLLAINRFAHPLPMAQFWVLATYYAAQVLIVRNARPVGPVALSGLRSMPEAAAVAS